MGHSTCWDCNSVLGCHLTLPVEAKVPGFTRRTTRALLHQSVPVCASGWGLGECVLCLLANRAPPWLLRLGPEGRDGVTGERGNLSEARCQPSSRDPGSSRRYQRGALQGETLSQRQLPAGDSRAASEPPRHLTPRPLAAPPSGLSRLHLWGQRCSTLRTWISKNKDQEEEKTKVTLASTFKCYFKRTIWGKTSQHQF